MDLRAYDIILVNTSAGKDSQVMLDEVCALALQQGVTSRVHAVHCDLERSEWAGTAELAAKQCAIYGVPLHVARRPQGDLLAHVEAKGKWPGPGNARYCTSDHKRDQATKVITQLVEANLLATTGRRRPRQGAAPVQVLNCIGLRAQESKERAAEPVLSRDERASSGVREITRWLPIHAWTEAEVWQAIRTRNLPYHFAYDLGMPRLSCVFCFYAPEAALLIAGYHNRALLAEHVAIETRINHQFKFNAPLINIQAKLEAGYIPQSHVGAAEWKECGGGY